MARVTKNDLKAGLKRLQYNVKKLAEVTNNTTPDFSELLDISAWNPGDKWIRYQLVKKDGLAIGRGEPKTWQERMHSQRWEGRYYKISELDGALELVNKILNELLESRDC